MPIPLSQPVVAPPADATDEPAHLQAARYVWALLLARIYEVLSLLCPQCGGAMKIIAFITETVVIREILDHLGEPESPPHLMQARGPPLWEMPGSETAEGDPRAQPQPRNPSRATPAAQPQPDHEFDQRIAW